MKPFDRETGEVLEPVTIYKKSHEIARAFDPSEAGKKGKRFVKLYSSRDANRQARKLDEKVRAYLYLLVRYAAPETNIILGNADFGTKGLPFTYQQMMELSGYSEPTFLKLLRQMVEIGVIEKLSRGYKINEKIAGVRRG